MIIEQGNDYNVHCDRCFEFIEYFEGRFNDIKGLSINMTYKNFCEDCVKRNKGKYMKDTLKNLFDGA